MAEESAKLRIPYIAASQAQKHVTHNEAMTLLDTLVQLSVIDKDLTTPPGSPSEGDTYIVAASATGAWIGWDNRVVRFIDGTWRSYLPGDGGGAGWLAWVLDEDAMYRFDGSSWALAGIEGPEGPAGPAGDPGDPGPTGPAGSDGADPGILLTWDTGTSDADPGPGKLRANNASLASATFLYISKTNRAGSSIAGKLLGLDDSTNSSRKAGLILTDPASEAQAFFDLTGVTDATGYVKAAVSGHSGATSFADGIAISFQDARDGDKGADGAGAGDVVGPASATDGRFALFDGTTGKIKEHTGAPGALAVKNTVGTSDIDNDAVTPAKMDNGSAVSVLGRSANSSGDRADIAAGSNGQLLGRLSNAVGFDTPANFGLQIQGRIEWWIPAAAFNPQITNGPSRGYTELSTNKQILDSLDFDTSTQEFANIFIKLPKKYNLGTVTFRPHWTAASGSGGVVWALQGVTVSDDDALDATWGTEQTSTDTLLSANDEHRGPESSAITLGGTPAAGDALWLRIKRNVSDGSDTLGVDAKLLGIELCFTANAADDT